MAPVSACRLAIFDLDRTLLPGSSLMLLGRALHRAGIIRRHKLLTYVAREAMFSHRGQSAPSAQRLLAALLAEVAGRDAEPLLDVVEALDTELSTAARPGARWLLDRHCAAGDYCVIVSASPQPLVEVASRALGAQRAVGTKLELVDGRFTGRLDGAFCHGRGKLARLWSDLGTADLRHAAAYCDSASDLPLLAAAGRPAAVNPDRRLRRAAAEAGWPVLRIH
jgi:HAD superfamily hydrolase (TIGR01490 family)